MSNASFMDQFAIARQQVAEMRKAFPWAFDANGRPLVAIATFPRVPQASISIQAPAPQADQGGDGPGAAATTG